MRPRVILILLSLSWGATACGPAASTGMQGDAGGEVETTAEPMLDLPPPAVVVGGMVEVPGGTFTWGCEQSDEPDYLCVTSPGEWTVNVPQREVHIDGFWIDQYEVRVDQYDLCGQAGACGPVESLGDWKALGKQRWAMTAVSWQEAKDYCTWRGGRLPTEAEWEKAARGTTGARYPWGNAAPECGQVHAFTQGCEQDTTTQRVGDVDAFPLDLSPYGVVGMAGNAQEWTNDYFDVDLYEQTGPNPSVPEPALSEDEVGVRGGYAQSHWQRVHVSGRSFGRTNARHIDRIGFRCLADQAPDSAVGDP